MFQLEAQLADRGVTIELSEEAAQWLAEKGYDEKFGARPLARVIQEHIKKPLADELLFGKLQHGGTVRVLVAGEGDGAQARLRVHPRRAQAQAAKGERGEDDDGDDEDERGRRRPWSRPPRARPCPARRTRRSAPKSSGTVPSVPAPQGRVAPGDEMIGRRARLARARAFRFRRPYSLLILMNSVDRRSQPHRRHPAPRSPGSTPHLRGRFAARWVPARGHPHYGRASGVQFDANWKTPAGGCLPPQAAGYGGSGDGYGGECAASTRPRGRRRWTTSARVPPGLQVRRRVANELLEQSYDPLTTPLCRGGLERMAS